MTSLLGGNFSDALHSAIITNQLLSHQGPQPSTDSEADPTTTFSSSAPDSPPYDPITTLASAMSEQSAGLTLDMFKDGLFASLVHPPPTDVAHSDTASSESPEPTGQSNSENDEMVSGTAEEHHSQQQSALSLIQSFGGPLSANFDDSSQESFFSEATIRDLMPVLAAAQSTTSPFHLNSSTSLSSSANATSSPSAWARNAGRKKSHPVWDFFRDMKDSTGSGGVVCLHCSWSGDDRSPNNLRTHLKKFHSDDGIFNRFSEKLAKTPTQPYVKRVRGGGGNGSGAGSSMLPSMVKMEQKPMIDSMTFFQQLQQGTLSESDFPFSNTSLNFLDSLPKSSEVININSGFIKSEEPEEDTENHVEASSSSSSEDPSSHNQNVDTPDNSSPRGTSSVQDQNDQLAAFVSSLTSSNPMMFAMLNAAGATGTSQQTAVSGQTKLTATLPPVPSTPPQVLERSLSPSSKLEKDPSSFSLSEGHCAAQLMSMALDLEMTMSYHRRRVDIELCFESNRTAEKSGGRGKVICLTDLGKEIKITERVNGGICDTELWTKTDFNQFHWAIRGKCQKCFNKQ